MIAIQNMLETWHLILLALLLALVVFMFNGRSAPPTGGGGEEAPIISAPDKPLGELLTGASAKCYGAEWCGFTKKQLGELEGEQGAYEYIDCEQDKERCTAAGINAFPTWEVNGKKHEGFMSKSRLQELCSP